MPTEASIARASIQAMPDGALEYDKRVKAALGLKVFLSRILQKTMKEFKGISIEEVENSIEGEILISKTAVNPALTNAPKKEMLTENVTEDTVPNEGTVVFDIHTYVRLPNKEMTKVIVNVEAQKDSYPGYDLETRAIFYCARLISSQLGREFSNKQDDPKKYANIKKVYSIWIVMAPPQHQSDSIVCYHIAPEIIYKNPSVTRRNIQHKPYYDLMTAVMVYMPYQNSNGDIPESGHELIKFLATLLGKMNEEERLNRLEKDFHIPLTTDVRKVVNEMCNLGEGLVEDGIKQGIKQGIEQNTIQSIKNLMKNAKWSAEESMKNLNIPETDFPKYLALL